MLTSRLKVIGSCQQESQFLGHEGGRQGGGGHGGLGGDDAGHMGRWRALGDKDM